MLHDKGFRALARSWTLPPLPVSGVPLAELRLYYVRLGFLASAYVNQVGQEPATVLPRNIALPLCDVCARLRRPPILSYDGYALFNWKRFDPAGPIALGNIDTIQNFVHLYDEHWFILVHVEIEALAAAILEAIDRRRARPRRPTTRAALNAAVAASPGRSGPRSRRSGGSPRRWTPRSTTRPSGPTSGSSRASSTRAWTSAPLNFRGETGAQSSVIPTLVAFLKIPHRPLDADRPPGRHAAVHAGRAPGRYRAGRGAARTSAARSIRSRSTTPSRPWRPSARPTSSSPVRYIAAHESRPPRHRRNALPGWLSQLIDETRAFKIP